MLETYSNISELLKVIRSKIKGKTKILGLDEILVLIPGKKKVKDIRGILKGKLDKSSVELVREERINWK